MKNKPAKNQVQETLKAARALIARPNGWTQGDECYVRTGYPTSYCSIGAIKEVATSQESARRALRILARVIAPRGSEVFAPIAYFNDARQRTKIEVLEAFDKAIEAAETSEGR